MDVILVNYSFPFSYQYYSITDLLKSTMLFSMLHGLLTLVQILFLVAVVFLAVIALTNWELYRFIIRMTIFFVSFICSSFLTCFGAFVTYFYNEGCMVAMRNFNMICSLWLDITVEVRGKEKIASASRNGLPVVIISNHQSSLDIFVMSCMWPAKCTAMMKRSLLYLFPFNIGAVLSNSIFVDRTNKKNAQEAQDDAISKMRNKGLKIWVFPEGTRHHEHGLLPFKKGAFNIAVRGHFPIVPVVFSDYTPFYSKRGRYFRPNGHVIVQVMDPVPTDQYGYEDVPSLCERIRQDMSEVYEVVSKDAAEVMRTRKDT